MHFQQASSAGPAVAEPETKPVKTFTQTSSSLPFGQSLSLSSIAGPTYLTAQTLVQQVAYTLSDKIFTYSPETFDLDVALKQWQAAQEKNAFGYATGVKALETRAGAGNLALGYIFSKDFDLSKRHIPQGIVASSGSLQPLRAALDQLALLYSVASPLVAHVAAVDYEAAPASGLVTDYATALSVADELGLGLVSSASVFEIQHMALFATLLASIVPTIHTYDGVSVGRETTRIVDVLDKAGLHNNYESILRATSGLDKKHSDNEGRTVKLLQAFNDELGTDYKLFEYHGHAEAEHVVVVFGTVEASLSAQVAASLASKGEKVGVINVRVFRPFVEEAFLEALPKTVQNITVLGQVKDEAAVADAAENSRLFTDVFAALSFSGSSANVTEAKYARQAVWTPSKIAEILKSEQSSIPILSDEVKQYTFWDVDDSSAVAAPLVVGQFLSGDASKNISVRSGYDNLVQGGVVRVDIRASSKSIEAAYSVDAADVAFVNESKLLAEFDVLNSVKEGGVVVVTLPGLKEDELEKKIPATVRKTILGKKLQLFVFDPAASTKVSEDASLQTLLTQLAFLRVASLAPAAQKLAALNGTPEVIEALSAELDQTLRQLEVPESWATVEPELESVALPHDINVNSFAASERTEPEPSNLLKDWKAAAKGLAFKEAYGTKSALRPDLPVKTMTVTVKERRRLTPTTYDRNIFHIEFDLGDSGLTYAIGEALGIHAENNKGDVEDFIKWYGLNPDEVVEVPSREDPTVLESRTVYQALIQNVDIFGRPPKRFYEALSEFATDEKEKQSLLALSTPEGTVEFKRRAEVDTITYADILLENPSAHPSFHDIIRIVNPMKRREYSIASSQHVTPNSVSLLIVTVGWVDPNGRDRFGQATRYLNGLAVGSPVTVSVKPSVMKLPAKSTAPIIMAGLGTGLAPFRAFIQERAYQKYVLGQEIGPVLLYMGSRHQREEYLYGEEWEAYQSAGIITLLGCAFSRDQPQKIYIQDRMRQTLAEIRDAYLKKEGSFYLCGPTWPVPDVTEVLQEAVEIEAKSPDAVVGKGGKVDSRREIETFKDAGRYVLEVY